MTDLEFLLGVSLTANAIAFVALLFAQSQLSKLNAELCKLRDVP